MKARNLFLIFIFLNSVTSLALDPLWSYSADGSVNALYPFGDDVASGSSESVYLFTRDGSLKWKYKTEGIVNSVFLDDSLIAASADRKVYFFNKAGELLWKKELPSYVGYDTALFSTNDSIYVGAMDGFLYVLTKKGDLKLKRKTDGYIIAVKQIDGKIIIASDKQIYSLELNGTTRRNFNLRGYIRSVDISNNYVAVALGDGSLKFFNLTGDLLWQKNLKDYVGPIHMDDGVAIGSKDNYLYLFDLDGKSRWKKNLNSSVVSVYLTEDHVAASTLDNSQYIFNRWGIRKWNFTSDDRVLKLYLYDGHLLMGAKDGRISYFAIPERNIPESLIALTVMAIVIMLALSHFLRAWG